MSIQLITPRCSAFVRPTWLPFFHLRYNDSLLWDGTGTELDTTQHSHTLFFDLDPRQAEGRAFWVYNNTDLFFPLSWCIYTGARPPRSWANGIAGNGYRKGERQTGYGKSGFDDVMTGKRWRCWGWAGVGACPVPALGKTDGKSAGFQPSWGTAMDGGQERCQVYIGHGVGW